MRNGIANASPRLQTSAVHPAEARHCTYGVTLRLSRGGSRAYCRRNPRLNGGLPRRRSPVRTISYHEYR
jgi:hypothetical protein